MILYEIMILYEKWRKFMQYYVYFIDEYGIGRCHCFEDEKEQAEHFASLVNGRIHYGY